MKQIAGRLRRRCHAEHAVVTGAPADFEHGDEKLIETFASYVHSDDYYSMVHGALAHLHENAV